MILDFRLLEWRGATMRGRGWGTMAPAWQSWIGPRSYSSWLPDMHIHWMHHRTQSPSLSMTHRLRSCNSLCIGSHTVPWGQMYRYYGSNLFCIQHSVEKKLQTVHASIYTLKSMFEEIRLVTMFCRSHNAMQKNKGADTRHKFESNERCWWCTFLIRRALAWWTKTDIKAGEWMQLSVYWYVS